MLPLTPSFDMVRVYNRSKPLISLISGLINSYILSLHVKIGGKRKHVKICHKNYSEDIPFVNKAGIGFFSKSNFFLDQVYRKTLNITILTLYMC